MGKKGLSSLVTALIIMVIAIVLVFTLWFFLKPFLSSSSEAGSAQACLIIQTDPVRCIYSQKAGTNGPEWYVTVKAKRGPDALNVSNMRLVFSNSQSSPSTAAIDWNLRKFGRTLPNAYETTDAGFILTSFLPETVAIAPIVSDNGYVCPASTPLTCAPYYYDHQGCSDIDGNSFQNGDDFDLFAYCYNSVSQGQPCSYNDMQAIPSRFDVTRDGFINLDDSSAFIEAFEKGDMFNCL
jgi:hypothetical protein